MINIYLLFFENTIVKLLSVNISPTILVEINGQQVQTAIGKTSFQDRFWLAKLTLWGYGKEVASVHCS